MVQAQPAFAGWTDGLYDGHPPACFHPPMKNPARGHPPHRTPIFRAPHPDVDAHAPERPSPEHPLGGGMDDRPLSSRPGPLPPGAAPMGAGRQHAGINAGTRPVGGGATSRKRGAGGTPIPAGGSHHSCGHRGCVLPLLSLARVISWHARSPARRSHRAAEPCRGTPLRNRAAGPALWNPCCPAHPAGPPEPPPETQSPAGHWIPASHRAVPTAPSLPDRPDRTAPRVGAGLGLETAGVGGAESGIAAERPPRSFRCPFSVDRCRV